MEDKTPAVVENPKILTIEEMLGAEDVEYATIPTWKVKDPKTGEMVQGYVRIGSLSAEDIIDWRETNDGPAKRTMGIRLLVNSLVDASGNRIGNAKHYELFKKKSNAVMERILAEVVRLNGMTVKSETTVKNG
jgi:hypothetical protein